MFVLHIFTLLFILSSPIFAFYNLSLENRWSTPENLYILNSNEDDFAPSWNKFENLLYFCSNRDKYSKFYTSFLDETTIFSNPILLQSELNQRRNNQSYITFLSENKAFLSTYKITNFRPYLNIFQSNKNRNQWDKPFPVDSLSGSFFISHPTISPDGTFLIFSTNKKNNKDTDLWIAYLLENGTFGNLQPINTLNSEGNEITPFLLSPDTLIFASDGFGGLGGYDLFYSVKINNIWQSPLPLHTLNSEYNESDPTILTDGSIVFASDRPGGKGKLDLYYAPALKSFENKQKISAPLEISIETQTFFVNFEVLKYKVKASSKINLINSNTNETDLSYTYNEKNINNVKWQEIELDSTKIIPKIINVITKCRPAQSLKRYELYLSFEGSKHLIKKANSLPDTFNINLWNYRNELEKNDVFQISASALNHNEEIFTTDFEIQIQKSINLFPKIEFNESVYEIYLIEFYNEIESIQNNIYLQKLKNELKTNNTKIKSIIVNDLTEVNSWKSSFANNISQDIVKSFNLSKNQIRSGIKIPLLQNIIGIKNKNIRTIAILIEEEF